MIFTKPALEIAVGGTLAFDVPEGDPTSGTVTIYDGNGVVTDIVADAATVVGGALTYAIDGTYVPVIAPNYRADWTYVVAGITYGPRRQTFEVVRAVSYPTLTSAKLTQFYAPILTGRYAKGETDHAKAIAVAWGRVQRELRARGKNPNDLVDPRPLEESHAHFASAQAARNFSAGSAQSAEWQAWAAEEERFAMDGFDATIANLEWIDLTKDLIPSVGEQNVGGGRVRLSR